MSKIGFDVILIDSARDSYFQLVDGFLRKKSVPPSRLIKLLSYSRKLSSKALSIFAGFGKADSWLIAQAFDLSLLVTLIKISMSEQPHFIQCEFPWTFPPVFFAKKLVNFKKVVLDEHNVETTCFQRFNYSKNAVNIVLSMEKFACRNSDYIFTVSFDDFCILRNWGFSEKKMAIVPNSVETRVFYPQIASQEVLNKIGTASTIILFHGNLEYAPNKEAIDFIITLIMPKIINKYPSVKFLIVGPSPPKFLHPNIIFTGYVENLLAYISVADIAIVPLLKGGGTRIKILEYIACGKPVVSTRIGAEGLNLENGKEIILVDDVSDFFVEKVIELIENKELRQKIGANARKKAVSDYDWNKTCDKAKAYLLNPQSAEK